MSLFFYQEMSDSEESIEEISAIAIEASVYNKPIEISLNVQQADSDIAKILGPLEYPNVILNCKICNMLYDLVCARVLADLYDQEDKGRQADLYELAFHKFYEVINNYPKKSYPQNELFRLFPGRTWPYQFTDEYLTLKLTNPTEATLKKFIASKAGKSVRTKCKEEKIAAYIGHKIMERATEVRLFVNKELNHRWIPREKLKSGQTVTALLEVYRLCYCI